MFTLTLLLLFVVTLLLLVLLLLLPSTTLNEKFRFLQGFFEKYPEYAPNPFYVFGESYGGHYAPAVSHRVWQGNK